MSLHTQSRRIAMKVIEEKYPTARQRRAFWVDGDPDAGSPLCVVRSEALDLEEVLVRFGGRGSCGE